MFESPDYLVQSPNISSKHKVEEVHAELDTSRFSSRAQADANTNIMDKEENVAKKRNLEGNIAPPLSDSNSLLLFPIRAISQTVRYMHITSVN
jgi:hypothetical protein